MIDTFAIRCNVLKLAFSGQLSQHEVEDGAIDDLLKRVNPNREIKQSEAGPYEIPENWAWVKLEDLYEINPKVEAADDTDAAFIPMERISAGFSDSFTFEVQKWSAASKNHTRFADGDVAFAKISPCFENRKSFIATGLPNGIGGGTTELIILRQKEMLPRFTYYVTLDQRFIHEGVASYKGTVGQQRVKSDVIKNYMVAVPPKEEQQRIIEKIESIFSALDTIDTLQSQYQDNLATLKSKIIDAGIQGKLTEQLPEDGNAEKLYQQIRTIQGIKKNDTTNPSADLPEIPSTWRQVRLGDIVRVLGGKRIPAGRKLTTENTGHKYIRISDMKDRSVDTERLLFVPEDIYPSIAQYIIRKEDVYITVAGTIGRVGKIPESIDGANLTENADRLVFSHLDQDWLIFCLSSTFVQKQKEFLTTQVAQPKLAIKRIQEFLIPLPPLAEQKRIVAKLEELLPLCEKGQS